MAGHARKHNRRKETWPTTKRQCENAKRRCEKLVSGMTSTANVTVVRLCPPAQFAVTATRRHRNPPRP
eukprot:m.7208 g.7208  ORF g.7208 m.7208 type:complete len:68 (+) comp18032_c0_seq1:14-217(+)